MDQPLQDPNQKESLRCWKQHTCVGCGTVYRYILVREADTKEAALEKLKTESDARPCPTCGLLQPEMVANVPLYANLTIAGIALTLLGLFTAAGFSGGSTPPDRLAMRAASIAGVAFFAHLLVLFINPNRNRAANLAQGESSVRNGMVQIVSPGTPDSTKGPPRSITPLHFVALLLILAGAGGFLWQLPALAEIGGLPSNGRHVPGGKVHVVFPDTIQSVNGLWNGVPRVEVLNAKEVGAPKELPGACDIDSWTHKISVSGNQESVHVHPYIDVLLPNDPNLEGKTLKLKLSLNIDYPHRIVVGKTFTKLNAKMTTTTDITLQGERYKRLENAWGLTVAPGLAGVVLGSFLLIGLTVAYKGKGNPTRLDPIEEDTSRRW